MSKICSTPRLKAIRRKALKEILANRNNAFSKSSTKCRRMTDIWKYRYSPISSLLSHSYLYNIKDEVKSTLLNNRDATYEIRIVSRREANRMRHQGLVIHVLGRVEKITQKEMLEKAQKYALLSDIYVREKNFFTPLPQLKISVLATPRFEPSPIKLRHGGPSSYRHESIHNSHLGGSFRTTCAPDSGGSGSPSGIGGMRHVSGGGSSSRHSSNSRLEQMVYTLIQNKKAEITKQKRSISQTRQSLERKEEKLAKEEDELRKIEKEYEEIKTGEDTAKPVMDKQKEEHQATLSVDPIKLLSVEFEENLLMSAMLEATETFLGPEHMLVEGKTRWVDYHVAICLQYYLHINHLGNPSLLYGLRCKYFNYFKDSKKFKTLRSYRQYCSVLCELSKNDFDRILNEKNGADKEKMIGRTSLHEWYSTYWRLAEIFQKKICHISTVTENKAKMKEG